MNQKGSDKPALFISESKFILNTADVDFDDL